MTSAMQNTGRKPGKRAIMHDRGGSGGK